MYNEHYTYILRYIRVLYSKGLCELQAQTS